MILERKNNMSVLWSPSSQNVKQFVSFEKNFNEKCGEKRGKSTDGSGGKPGSVKFKIKPESLQIEY